MRDLTSAFGAICVAGFLASACGGISDPSKNIIENFTATVQPGGGRVHEFDVAPRTGEYTATITAVSPNAKTIFGISLGQVVDGLCTPLLGQVGFAVLNQLALNSQIQKGHYCIQVYDSSSAPLTADQTYTLRVSHP